MPKIVIDEKAISKIDLSAPAETIIYNSKVTPYVIYGVIVFLNLGGICAAFKSRQNLFAPFFTAVISAAIWAANRSKIVDKSPQIIINEKGIESPDAQFCEWDHISDEEMYEVPKGRATI